MKPILSIAVHPSGYYMAAGFVDKVRVMHILDDELRDFRILDHKNVSKMKFSNGGQFLVIVEQRMFYIYSSYTLELLTKNKSASTTISSISFNTNDTGMAMTAEGFVSRYDLVNFKFKGEGTIDRNCDFRSSLFIPDAKDEFKIMTVGAESSHAFCRVYNQNEDVELTFKDVEEKSHMKSYSEACHVKS